MTLPLHAKTTMGNKYGLLQRDEAPDDAHNHLAAQQCSCPGRYLGCTEPKVTDQINSVDILEGQPLTTEIPICACTYIYMCI